MENDITINDNLSISELEVAGTDLCLKKISHLVHEFKRKLYFNNLLL